MSSWYEVFDNEEVQWAARTQATRTIIVAIGAAFLTLGAVVLWAVDVLEAAVLVIVIVVGWMSLVRWSSQRLRRLRRLVWCVKLSPDHIVGYDYTRHKKELAWTSVVRVELLPAGLLVAGPDLCRFEIPHLYPEFHALSHRIVEYAERYDVPVTIDGTPWDRLDVYQIFPFLALDSPDSSGVR